MSRPSASWKPWPKHDHRRRSPCCIEEAARFLRENGWGVVQIGAETARHPLVVVNVGKDRFGDPIGTCAACGQPCYEYGDHRGGALAARIEVVGSCPCREE